MRALIANQANSLNSACIEICKTYKIIAILSSTIKRFSSSLLYILALMSGIFILTFSLYLYSEKEDQEDVIVNFYHTKSGEMIMNPTTYSEGIKKFLEKEHEFILNHIKKYDVFFEIGCGPGHRASEVVKQCDFFGIDINPNYIQLAKQSFVANNIHERARTELISANSLNPNSFPIDKEKHVLIYYPFNLLGNITDFEEVLENMIDIGSDFCFSTYKINEEARESRKSYYTNCGCQQLQYTTNPIGDLFRSKDGLHSAAFRIGYMIELINMILNEKKKTCSITISDLTEIGYVIYVTDIGDWTPAN